MALLCPGKLGLLDPRASFEPDFVHTFLHRAVPLLRLPIVVTACSVISVAVFGLSFTRLGRKKSAVLTNLEGTWSCVQTTPCRHIEAHQKTRLTHAPRPCYYSFPSLQDLRMVSNPLYLVTE